MRIYIYIYAVDTASFKINFGQAWEDAGQFIRSFRVWLAIPVREKEAPSTTRWLTQHISDTKFWLGRQPGNYLTLLG